MLEVAQAEAEQEALIQPAIRLFVGAYIECENGQRGGPLFQQLNGQYTLGMQFITWNEDGTSVTPGYKVKQIIQGPPMAEFPSAQDDGGSVPPDHDLPIVDAIDAEVQKLLSADAIHKRDPKKNPIDYITDTASFIARGAALRAYQDGLRQAKTQTAVTVNVEFTDDEIETLRGIQDRSLKVMPTGDHALAMRLKGHADSIINDLNDEAPDLLAEYLRRQWEWSLRTFGPGFRTAGILQHIRKELGEVEKEPHDLMEWLDIIILAFDGYWRHGGSPERAIALLQKKQDKNFARNWPDWRTLGEDKAIEHDRSGE
ncbi:protein of unknown function DUF550 [Rhizobium phage RHph_X2_30]|nr:protein of unknown function DUF550 [Rhizobium phage RHph_X2_30]